MYIYKYMNEYIYINIYKPRKMEEILVSTHEIYQKCF